MTDKKKILVLTEWYLPGRNAGGPVKSIESLVWAMADHFDFNILTTNRDLGETENYKNIETDRWISREDGSQVYYMDSLRISESYLENVINAVQYDFLYINSYYSKWFSIVPLRLKKKNKIKGKVVLAPRGMLSNGAIAIKTLKKKTFIRISGITGLHDGLIWHATYPEEEREIRKYYGDDSDIRLAENFSKPLKYTEKIIDKRKGELKLFYLSRISRVKNLHLALEALQLINRPDVEILYDIYGNTDDEFYFEECSKIAANLPANVRVRFQGPVKNENITDWIHGYHFLFLPTSNENFGHSIFESLQSGVPVIISDATPWKNLEAKGCGWDVKPAANTLAQTLIKALDLEDSEFKAMKSAAVKVADVEVRMEKSKKETLELFRDEKN